MNVRPTGGVLNLRTIRVGGEVSTVLVWSTVFTPVVDDSKILKKSSKNHQKIVKNAYKSPKGQQKTRWDTKNTPKISTILAARLWLLELCGFGTVSPCLTVRGWVGGCTIFVYICIHGPCRAALDCTVLAQP